MAAPTKVEYKIKEVSWPTVISPICTKVAPYQTTATIDPNKQKIIKDAKAPLYFAPFKANKTTWSTELA